MASFEFLDRAANGYETRLRLVTGAQRTLATPCPERNVHDLVAHQIRGMRIYTLLLHGAAREVVAKEQDSDIGSDDWIAAFGSAYRAVREAFCAPGALERTVAHPGMGEIPATMLFDMQLGGWRCMAGIWPGPSARMRHSTPASWPPCGRSRSPCPGCCHPPATSLAPAGTYRIRLPCKPGCSTC